jgi:hypothetical protein
MLAAAGPIMIGPGPAHMCAGLEKSLRAELL